MKHFEEMNDWGEWREDNENVEGEETDDDMKNKYFCPITGAHFNFIECCDFLRDLKKLSMSQRRAGYEYESDEDVVIPELIDKENFINSPHYQKQFWVLIEPEPEEETEPRMSRELYTLKK